LTEDDLFFDCLKQRKNKSNKRIAAAPIAIPIPNHMGLKAVVDVVVCPDVVPPF